MKDGFLIRKGLLIGDLVIYKWNLWDLMVDDLLIIVFLRFGNVLVILYFSFLREVKRIVLFKVNLFYYRKM